MFFQTLSRTGGSGKDQDAIEDVERGDRRDGRQLSIGIDLTGCSGEADERLAAFPGRKKRHG